MKNKSSEDFNFNLTILNLLKQGKNPSKISKELNISMPNLSYHLRKMKEKGYIQKKGYGLWEVKMLPTRILTNSVKEIRGHAFIWVVKVPQEIQGLIKERAKKKGTQMNKGQVRLIIKNHKVWVGNKSIVIYENKSFYAKNSIESRKYAVISMIDVLQGLQRELGVSMKRYVFKPSKEHYGQIKNDLARQYNKNNEKLLIHDDLEGDWLWIDDSESLNELEVSGKKAVVRSKQVQDWWNDHKKHNFELSASKTLEMINGLTISQQQTTNNLNDYAVHIKAHTEAIKSLSKAIPELVKVLKQTQKENESLKQRRLTEW